jgi:polygalacturonase
MENKTWNASLEIRNCKILKQHRARGILVTTPKKVIIEDNYFRTAGTAILIEGDMNYWFESGANRDVTIRNNVFDNCLTSGCITGSGGEWGEAVITVTPSHRPQNDKDEPYHQNIHIENNIFKTFDIPLVHARSVRGLIFRNNEIVRTNFSEPYLWQKVSFRLDGCRDVVISGNKIDKDYVTRTIDAQHIKKSDLKIEGFQLNLKK